METVGLLQVFLLSSFTAVATGFGALPFFFVKGLTRRWLGASNTIAVRLMLAASFGLVYEGLGHSVFGTLAGAVAGLAFIVLVRWVIQQDGHHHAAFAEMGKLDAGKALLVVGVMTLHSVTEGVGVGVSFGGGAALGLFITLAIAVHNVPEGLAAVAMIWMVFSELLPDALEDASGNLVGIIATVSIVAMIAFQVLIS